MSDMVFSEGHMVCISTPLNDDLRNKIEEAGFHLNDDETLIFSDNVENEEACYEVNVSPAFNATAVNQFLKEVRALGILVKGYTASNYNCTWHNSTDSTMFYLTEEEYLKKLGLKE